jgi:hypothetical protein
MMNTQHAATPVDKAAQLMDTESTNKSGHCQIDQKLGADMHMAPELYIAWPSNREISVKLSCDEQHGVNEAEILLPIEEVQRFTKALIEHPLLLPTSYSQNSSVKGEKHSLLLVSEEPFADFAERLSDALSVLGKK